MELLTPDQVAAILNVTRPTVISLVKNRGLPCLHLSKRVYRFHLAEVMRWAAQQKITSKSEEESNVE